PRREPGDACQIPRRRKRRGDKVGRGDLRPAFVCHRRRLRGRGRVQRPFYPTRNSLLRLPHPSSEDGWAMTKEFTRQVKSPEDAVRHYDGVNMDGFACERDAQPDEGWLRFVLTILCVLVLALGAGMVIAAVWSASDEVPARGVMDDGR